MRRSVVTETEYEQVDFKLLKRLTAFLKPYYKYAGVALFVALLSTALEPLRPYLTKIAVDDYIATGDTDGLIKMIIIVFGVIFLSALMRFGLTYLMQWVGQRTLFDIREKIFERVQSQAMKFFDRNPIGKLVTRTANEVEVLNKLFTSGIVMAIADLALIGWLIAFMFYTNWKLALLTLAILPFLIIATSYFRKKIRDAFRKIRLKVSEMNAFLNEFIGGIETIKLFAKEKLQSDKFDSINKKYKNLWDKTIFYYALFFPIVEILRAVAIGIVIWYAARNFLSGDMTVGVIIAFIQYAEMFFRPIRDLTEKYATLQSSMAASEKIFGILGEKNFVEQKEDAVPIKSFKDKIKFKNVYFSYDGEKQVLKDVSFTVNKGDKVALVGLTGAGKTSVINLLGRFYEFDAGEILIDGIDIRRVGMDSLRDLTAIVTQDAFLFSRTIADNISLGDEEIGWTEIKEAAEALGAEDFIAKLQNRYEYKLNERGKSLSAGQRQLISFCRAYAANPQILVLDEASSNIDSETEKLIEESLEKLMRRRTSIVIAHRLSTIKKADKIIVLHKGKIAETGTLGELLKKDGVYSKLYRTQFQNGIVKDGA